MACFCLDGSAVAEQLFEAGFGSPKGWRFHSGRRRQVLADGLKDLADKAGGGPVGEPYLAAGFADTQHFGGGAFLIGGEHDAERGNHGVE